MSGHRSLRLFLLSFLCAAAVVLAAGWLTALKQVMHGALIAVAQFAFLPFTIIAAGLLLAGFVLMISLLVAILSGGGEVFGGEIAEPFAEVGLKAIPPYYRWIARQRHPVFWGVPAGVLFGGLLLWAFIAAVIVPGEARTVQTLADVQAEIERIYKDRGRYPRPDDSGHLPYAALGRSDMTGVVTDGFDRPIQYEVVGRWRLASYRLRAYGYDGVKGKDDFCVSGSTKLARLSSLIKAQRKDGRVSITLKLGAIKDLRCDDRGDGYE